MADEERTTWANLAHRLTGTLPPGFLALLASNTVILGMLFWFLDKQMVSRLALLEKLIDTCTNR